MTDFRADCIIHLHVGKAKGAHTWACLLSRGKDTPLVLAQNNVDEMGKEEAELRVLLYGLQQATRLLQEKVELRASFPLDKLLPKKISPGKELPFLPEPHGDEKEWRKWAKHTVARTWGGFRLRRLGKFSPEEAELLRKL